jgi:phage/conjugal plasmid C-4 type zinc finger TraR family protein
MLALAARPRTPAHGVSASHCAECGEAIPEARRVAVPGCDRCAECAGLAERRELIRRRTGR